MAEAVDDVPLVGRETELAVLRGALESASAGQPRAVLVVGESGVGKSRLVRELLGDKLVGLTVRTQCVDLGDPGLAWLSASDLLRGLAEAGESAAGAALDDLGANGDDESRRLQLFAAMTGLLGDVAASRGPLVVVVEDLQWIDASSAELLRFLVNRMGAERLLVVATLRTDGLAGRPRVRQLAAELDRLPLVRRLDLAPLDVDEVARYLALLSGDTADPGLAATVHGRTGGNPYYVHTLAVGEALHDDAVPKPLTELLVGKVDGLPDDVKELVRRVAIAAHAVPDRLLRHVAGLPDAAADEALRVAVNEGVLRAEGDGYVFAHDLLRAAVHDDLLPGERARLHASHAAALASGAAGPAPAAEVAHHFAAARDARNLLAWSLRAADAAAEVVAPEEELHHLEQVLGQWPAVEEAESLAGMTRGRVAVRAAQAARLAGEDSRAVDWANLAIQLCDAADDPEGRVRARVELVRQLIERDVTDPTVSRAEEAARLAAGASLGGDVVALAEGVLARALVSAHRADEARPHVDLALAEARSAGLPGLEVEALATAAFVDEITGDRECAAAQLGAALRLARETGEVTAELRAHFALASLHYYAGEVAAALPVLEVALARVEESGLRWSNAGVELRLLQTVALYVAGELAASQAIAEVPVHPPDLPAARLAAVGCYAAVARGAEDAGERLVALRDRWEIHPQVALVAGGCEADHLSWQGDFSAAVAVAERAQAHMDRVAGEGMYGGLWLSALGLAALADQAAYSRQRRDEAAATAAVEQGERLRERVERIVGGGHGRPGDLGPEGRAWHARALAEHARLLGEPAVERWQAALEAFGYGQVYEQARCRWRLVDALVDAGDRAAARTIAREAAEAAARMGALPLKGAIAASVSRARLAGPESSTDGVLTAREREVLALVAEGLTNREVGQRLFISEKTASVHLSNVMAKLNVSSRTEAVTVAARRGLLDVG